MLMRDPSWVGLGHGIAVSYLWVYTLEGKVIRDTLELYPESHVKVRKVNMRWMMARMIVKAARVVKEFRRAEDVDRSATPFDVLKIMKERKAAQPVRYASDEDGVEAAKRFAAREAVRQAEAGTEMDRLSKIQQDVQELMRIVNTRLPPSPKPVRRASRSAGAKADGSIFTQDVHTGLLQA